MEREQVRVSCYSGSNYAERPTAFLWEGTEHRVRDMERGWLEPGEKHFRLRTEDDRLFELCYYEDGDRWSVIESVSKSEKGRKR